ncbi:hypothetical protein MRX96_026272 [Rhipicephalus microplus]
MSDPFTAPSALPARYQIAGTQPHWQVVLRLAQEGSAPQEMRIPVVGLLIVPRMHGTPALIYARRIGQLSGSDSIGCRSLFPPPHAHKANRFGFGSVKTHPSSSQRQSFQNVHSEGICRLANIRAHRETRDPRRRRSDNKRP